MTVTMMHRNNIKRRWATAPLVVLAVAILGGCVVQPPVRTVAVRRPQPQRLFVYPSRGQSPDQLERDRYACHVWAVKETGVDPTSNYAGPYDRVVVQPAPGSATVAGAVGGAIVGSILGGDDNSGIGALIGGATGAVIGSAADANAQAQAQAAQHEIASERAGADAYRRAISACLDARGYTVR